jgi:hypothetical protein
MRGIMKLYIANHKCRFIVLLSSLTALFLVAAQEVVAGSVGKFTATGSMQMARVGHAEIMLPSGKVLIVGGDDSGTSAEIYYPSTGTFHTTGSLNFARYSFTATLLDNGKVLIQGGSVAYPTLPAELYDPATGAFSQTGVPLERFDWFFSTATLLKNGNVLVVGGETQIGPSSLAELYDSATGTFTFTAPSNFARHGHAATMLRNGKVLITGGDDWFDGGGSSYAVAELYDPSSGTFSAPIPMLGARAGHTATLLRTGKVLVTGGYFEGCCGLSYGEYAIQNINELFDPATSTFTRTGDSLHARTNHSATLLRNGQVLVAGGSDGNPTSAQVSSTQTELYDPVSGTFSVAGSMTTARAGQAAMLLKNGRVLVTGGVDDKNNPLASAEVYTPSKLRPRN